MRLPNLGNLMARISPEVLAVASDREAGERFRCRRLHPEPMA